MNNAPPTPFSRNVNKPDSVIAPKPCGQRRTMTISLGLPLLGGSSGLPIPFLPMRATCLRDLFDLAPDGVYLVSLVRLARLAHHKPLLRDLP